MYNVSYYLALVSKAIEIKRNLEAKLVEVKYRNPEIETAARLVRVIQ